LKKGAPQIFQQCKRHLRIVGAIRVTCSKFHSEDPQILGTTVESLVARVAWSSGFVQRWPKEYVVKREINLAT